MIVRPTHRNCLSRTEIRNYLDDPAKFSRDELHQLESHLLDCELCENALEGYKFLKETDILSYQKKLSADNIEINPSLMEIFDQVEKARDVKSKNGLTYRDLSKGENQPLQIAAESSLEFFPESKNETATNQMNRKGAGLKSRLKGWKWGIRVAASLLIIIMAGTWIFSTYFQGIDVDKIFGQGEELVIRVRGVANESDIVEANDVDQIDLAMEAFEQGDYLQSGGLFESALASENSNSALIFFAGLSFLNAGELEKAELYLPRSVEKDHVFIEEAHWHLARLHLEMGDPEAARGALQYLRNSENKDLRMKAISLLRRL